MRRRVDHQGRPLISLLRHGGRTREMLTIEIGRTETRRKDTYNGREALELVVEWLIEQGVTIESRNEERKSEDLNP